MGEVHQFKSREELIKESEEKSLQEMLDMVNDSFKRDDHLCISVIYPGSDDVSNLTIVPNIDIMDEDNMLRTIAILEHAKHKLQLLMGGLPYLTDPEE